MKCPVIVCSTTNSLVILDLINPAHYPPLVKQGAGAPNSKHKNESDIDIHQTQKQYGHRNNQSLPQEQSDYNDCYT